jgi:hypothetical protein
MQREKTIALYVKKNLFGISIKKIAKVKIKKRIKNPSKMFKDKCSVLRFRNIAKKP